MRKPALGFQVFDDWQIFWLNIDVILLSVKHLIQWKDFCIYSQSGDFVSASLF